MEPEFLQNFVDLLSCFVFTLQKSKIVYGACLPGRFQDTSYYEAQICSGFLIVNIQFYS